MNRSNTRGTAALVVLLAGCGTAATPAAQTVTTAMVTTVTAKAAAVTQKVTTTKTATETVTKAPEIEFDELYADVRTGAAGAFDGWSNDTMKVVADMVCGVYHPEDQSEANVQAAALASALIAIGVDTEHIVDVAKPILTANCDGSLGYFPNM